LSRLAAIVFPAPRNFCARDLFPEIFRRAQTAVTTKKENYESYESENFDPDCNGDAWRRGDAGASASSGGGGNEQRQCHRPEDPALHLPDASVGEIGKAGRLPDLRHETSAGLCQSRRDERSGGKHEHQQAGCVAGLLFDGRMLQLI
jgi:hypothetical protein